ncbi:hypothetical protein CesoFtcFv8_027098 [Champsocephalus esox]|uniref:Uncharacterized protein n=1 Tax=Champsocephalus esox TaxID=159716 RepID=A0AAN8GAS5_9TELE|nr:hypothetical protein CesoFtcFv8_027098 [Champsocephalus esox]
MLMRWVITRVETVGEEEVCVPLTNQKHPLQHRRLFQVPLLQEKGEGLGEDPFSLQFQNRDHLPHPSRDQRGGEDNHTHTQMVDLAVGVRVVDEDVAMSLQAHQLTQILHGRQRQMLT